MIISDEYDSFDLWIDCMKDSLNEMTSDVLGIVAMVAYGEYIMAGAAVLCCF